MVDLIIIASFIALGALTLRRYRVFKLLPWQGPHDLDTWAPDFILDRLDR